MKKSILMIIMVVAILSMSVSVCVADNTNADIANAYWERLNAPYESEPDWYYSIYDIDKNGIPELIIDDDLPHAIRNVYIFTYDNGLKFLGSFSPSYAELCEYPDGNGLVLYNAYRNHEWLDLLKYNNVEFYADNLTESVAWPEGVPYDEPEQMWNGAYRLKRCHLNDASLLNSELPQTSSYTEPEYSIPKPEISVIIVSQWSGRETKVVFDQPPVIMDGRTLVPMRAIFEALGMVVNWDDNTKTVTASGGQTDIVLTIGDYKLYRNTYNRGNATFELDVPAQIINGRTLVPIRAIGESLDAEVGWDGETNTITINGYTI